MKTHQTVGSAPIRLWGRTVPRQALEQLEQLAAMPFIVGHIAAMPDLHVASGVCVGTVFATRDVIVPAALGGDLGCGMSAVHFGCAASSLSRSVLERLLVAMGRAIPVGDQVHRGPGLEVPAALNSTPLSTHSLERDRERLARRHLGTLGGGNHFIELDRDGGGELWLLVHSGSRGLGAAIAAHHLTAAERATPEARGALASLSLGSAAGQACLSDYAWANAFATANRAALVARAAGLLSELVGVAPDEPIDVPHNFIAGEQHHGHGEVLVHRKGAIAAPAGKKALIPGSMGTASYVVEGLGNEAAWGSASHGAGRVLTRRQAREQVRPERLAQVLRRVVFDERRLKHLVEEAPSAYRDITEVLEDEGDLVRPVTRLEPIAVLKG